MNVIINNIVVHQPPPSLFPSHLPPPPISLHPSISLPLHPSVGYISSSRMHLQMHHAGWTMHYKWSPFPGYLCAVKLTSIAAYLTDITAAISVLEAHLITVTYVIITFTCYMKVRVTASTVPKINTRTCVTDRPMVEGPQ